MNMYEYPDYLVPAEKYLQWQIDIMNAALKGSTVEVKYRWEGALPSQHPGPRITFNWSDFNYRIVPSKLAAGHNPRDLTEDQVEVKDGWRLLTKEEVTNRVDFTTKEGCQFWSTIRRGWEVPPFYSVPFYPSDAYRTKKPAGYFLPKPKIAAGHNPRDLTEDQVEVKDGWRLLAKEEIDNARRTTPDIEAWGYQTDGWDCTLWGGCRTDLTYRTKKPAGYFLPKKPETDDEALIRIYQKAPFAGVIDYGRHVLAWERSKK